MPRETLPITPSVLTWARERAGHSIDELREDFKGIEDWDDLSFPVTVNVQTMASRVREYLGVSIADQKEWPNVEVALENWRRTITEVGVFIFKDAFKGDEYSGFCIYDDEFPVIYVNNSAAKTRQIFTLFHELAHLIFHTSGVDTEADEFVDAMPANARRIELLCNRFAAEFLLPEAELSAAIAGQPITRETAASIARAFCVSREVVYRKFLDRGLITSTEYGNAVGMWKTQPHRESSGGDYYNTQMAYLGANYIRLAFNRYYQNRIDGVQLAEFLNITPRNLSTFEARFAARRA
jgi:Zn-dependent peptidase ImmA (M78 family)